jgi:hypothetical protein
MDFSYNLGFGGGFQKPAKLGFMNDLYSYNSSAAEAPAKSELKTSHSDKLVSAEQLLALLWEENSRPSLRWLREQQARRTIPFIKIGARVWFQPSEVRGHLLMKWGVRRR